MTRSFKNANKTPSSVRKPREFVASTLAFLKMLRKFFRLKGNDPRWKLGFLEKNEYLPEW